MGDCSAIRTDSSIIPAPIPYQKISRLNSVGVGYFGWITLDGQPTAPDGEIPLVQNTVFAAN